MKEVNARELWNYVKDKEVTFSLSGEYPYTGLWIDKKGNVIAKYVPAENGKRKYYINNE